MRLRKKPHRPQAVPIPLWLQSFYEFLRIVLIVGALTVFPMVVVSGLAAGGHIDWLQRFKLGGNIFLVCFGVPLQILKKEPIAGPALFTDDVPDSIIFNNDNLPADAQFVAQGEFSFTPLMMILIVIFLTRRAGYSLACAAQGRRLWQVAFGWVACVAGCGLLVSLLCGTETMHSNMAAAAFIPLIPTGFGLFWGMQRRGKTPSDHDGATDPKSKSHPGGRNLRAYVASVFKSNAIGLLLVCCVSAATLTVGLCLKWADIAGSFQLLDADWAGDLEFFMIQLMYIPNLVIMMAAWFSGAGFYLGSNVLLTPFNVSDIPVPLVPVLHGFPGNVGPFGVLAPILFIIIGIVVGRWFWLYAENYVDEVFDMRFNRRILSLMLSSIVNAGTISAFFAAVLIFFGWIGSGEVGFSGLYYGSRLPWFGIYAAAGLGGGIFMGQIMTAYREYHQLYSGKANKTENGSSKIQGISKFRKIQ